MNDTANKRVDDAIAAGAANAEIERLASLSALEYEQQREATAERLGLKAPRLDILIKAAKRKKRSKKRDPADPATPPIDAAKAKADAGDLATCADILDRFATCVTNAGLVGETNNAKIIYLALTSRLFDREIARPVSIAVKGVSAGGKSYTVECVLKFFPASAYFDRSSGSDKWLYFSEENFKHRFIVIWEAVGMGNDRKGGDEVNHFAYAVRTLLSENCLKYELPVKTEGGIKNQVMEKEGPTGLITTTTATKLHPENETRLLSLGVIDTPEQTGAVMEAIAVGKVDNTDYAPWRAFQEWLTTGDRRVWVPYALALAKIIPPVTVRLRRDFKALLSLIHAHALLHRENRERDDRGYIVATVADYAAVYNLIEKLFSEGIEVTVPATVRETVEAASRCLASGGDNPRSIDDKPTVSVTALAKELKLDRTAAGRRVRTAIAAGYLENKQDRPGKPARLALGDPLPVERGVLPEPAVLECAAEHLSSDISRAETVAHLHRLLEMANENNAISAVSAIAHPGPTCAHHAPPVHHPKNEPSPSEDSTINPTRAPVQLISEGRNYKRHNGASEGDDPIPEVLRRCDHCGQPATAANPMHPYDWEGRPDGIRLHRGCEADWFDSFRPAPGPAALPPRVVAKQPDAVADVLDQAEKVPPAAEVISAPEPVPSAETARTPPSVTDRSSEAVGSRRCAVCGDDLYRCFPLRCPRRSASNSLVRNKEEERLH